MSRLATRLTRARRVGARWLRCRKRDLSWLTGRAQFAARYEQLRSDHEWIFVVGCNNSGTTLVHDALAATGEFSYFPSEGQQYTEVLGRGDRRGHERVWSEYLDDLRLTEQSPLDRGPRLLFDWLEELGNNVRPRVLEKTTANSVRMRWLQSVFPRASFIGIVRDGRAVVEGIHRKAHKSVERGAVHWAQVNQILLSDAKYLKRFELIKYEQFVEDPTKVLSRLGTFLGLPPSALSRSVEHVLRPSGLGRSGGIENMNASSFRRLAAGDLAVIEGRAGAMLRELGYPLPNSP